MLEGTAIIRTGCRSMWTINLSRKSGWCIDYLLVDAISGKILQRSPGDDIDLSDHFWSAITDSGAYDVDNIKIIREIIKRKIPFKLQFIVTSKRNPVPHMWYYYINYTIVVDNPKYAVLCKLIWGETNI